MNDNDKPTTLEGEDALALWRQGKEEWNQWVEANPVADVNFNGAKFTFCEGGATNAVDFTEYRFPKGTVSFCKAKFGKGFVSFNDAKFGDGDVSFEKATFDGRNVSFQGATFGMGNVNFSRATFGDGDVNFNVATFGEGRVNFSGTTFGMGNVDFSLATFGEGRVNFSGTTFGDGHVNFIGTTFGDGDVLFNGATFGDGNVWFDDATFGDGDVWFDDATFGDGNFSFNGATFGNGHILFNKAHFKGHVTFAALKNTEGLASFTLRHAIFEKSLDLSQNNFNCVIDLTNTKMANQVSLDGLQCKLNRTWYGKAKDNKDSERLRRLKEIAENNKDHTQALIFHADEMRANRWHKITLFKTLGMGLDLCFDWLSDYGQSIGKPLLALLVITAAFGYLYHEKATELGHEVTPCEVILYSASNMLPFIPTSREARVNGIAKLFGVAETRPYGLHGWILLQGALSFIFLFLLGLGLRNRFRI